MKSFKSGIIVGILSSVAVAAATALSYRHTVIKPAQEAEEHHEEVSTKINNKTCHSPINFGE